jgi:hypothetical protein
MELAQLKLPVMRSQLISCLESLSDRGYQERVWGKYSPNPPVTYDGFDTSIHFIFDDMSLNKDAISAVGEILIDANEVSALTAVTRAIETLFDKYGTRLTDAEYLARPEWEHVLATAKAALRLLVENGGKDNWG